MLSNLFLNVHWPLSQGAVQHLCSFMFCCRFSLLDLRFNVLFLLQVVLLSATMPAEVLEVTKKFMRDPIRILVKKEELTLEGIKQFYINVEREVGLLNFNTTSTPVSNIA